ncbi:glycosyltransferase family 8 protein [Phenylobacterium sp.]|uniref:glycosyltransferase family 8 protein n=1 Tax=Phenylobacterium sp. TaxID=1871053 RepID=UPI0035B446C7
MTVLHFNLEAEQGRAAQSDRIDIGMGFDRNYAAHAGVVIHSVARYTDASKLRFVLVHDGVEPALQARVESVAPEAEYIWIQIRDEDVPDYATRGHLNRSVLFRLLLEKLAPADSRRIIYIDADVIVLRDIAELWRSDLAGQPIGAVTDAYCEAAEFAELWNLPAEGGCYFNAGMLVIDLDQVRAEQSFSKALAFVVEHDKKLLLGDQDALNAVFWRRWTHVGADWNVQRFVKPGQTSPEGAPQHQISPAGPALVHFITQDKPWTPNAWHPWSWMYWRNLARTPFFKDVTRQYKVTLLHRLRLRLKWMRDRPRFPGLEV